VGISDRDIISAIISSKYDDNEEMKRKIINLFFSGKLTTNEFTEIKKTINETSENFRRGLEFMKGIRLNEIPIAVTKENIEKRLKFEPIKQAFDFRVGPEESNLNFRLGPQTSYFYIKLDHFLKGYQYDTTKIRYSTNRKFNISLKIWETDPIVYINTHKSLFKNILNFLKEKDWLDEFIFGFEEKILIVT